MEDVNFILYKDPYPNGIGNPNSPHIISATYSKPYRWFSRDLRNLNMNDCISAIYLHPNCKLTAYKDFDFTGVKWVFYGKDYPDGNITAFKLRELGADDCISSVMVEDGLIDRDEWLRTCCRNENTNTTDSKKCGKYWGSNTQACSMYKCNGNDILSGGPCTTWCKNNPESCDAIKTTFCQSNLGHPACKCIIEPDEVRNDRINKGYFGPRQCWPTSDCQKTDLVQTLITTDLLPRGCPDSLIQNLFYNNSGISFGNKVSQCGAINSEACKDNSTGDSNNYLILIIIFIIIIVITTTVILLLDDEPENFNSINNFSN